MIYKMIVVLLLDYPVLLKQSTWIQYLNGGLLKPQPVTLVSQVLPQTICTITSFLEHTHVHMGPMILLSFGVKLIFFYLKLLAKINKSFKVF